MCECFHFQFLYHLVLHLFFTAVFEAQLQPLLRDLPSLLPKCRSRSLLLLLLPDFSSIYLDAARFIKRFNLRVGGEALLSGAAEHLLAERLASVGVLDGCSVGRWRALGLPIDLSQSLHESDVVFMVGIVLLADQFYLVRPCVAGA